MYAYLDDAILMRRCGHVMLCRSTAIMSQEQQPDVQDGIEYWNTQPASLDGVLGGYGSGVLVFSVFQAAVMLIVLVSSKDRRSWIAPFPA